MTSIRSDAETDSGRRDRVVRSALLRFALWSVVALVLLAAGAIVIAGQIAKDAALREARLRGATIADTIAGPLVGTGVRAGDPQAVSRLDATMRARMSDGSLSHVKLWSDKGVVLWADEKALVGRTFPLDGDVSGLFGTSEVTAELSDLSKLENVGERGEGQLLEVYVGARGADNQPFVFEAYLSTDQMRASERAIIKQIVPLAVGGLLLFQLAVLPLAVSLARRVEKGENERSRMMRHSLQVTTQERRRIAQELHDGVIQDLAGLRYTMPVVEAHLPDAPEADGAREAVRRVSAILKDDVAMLRSMLTDIYPPNLDGAGFAQAVQDLAEHARERGTAVVVDIPDDYDEAIDPTRLAYQVIREGLRNVIKHAHAGHARVAVRREGATLHVEVSDDGVGLVDAPTAKGHLGLRILEDTLRDFGGRLEVLTDGDRGTVLEARFPANLVGA
jgi:signal transduction histidine kinase